jgi:hypothetical protein
VCILSGLLRVGRRSGQCRSRKALTNGSESLMLAYWGILDKARNTLLSWLGSVSEFSQNSMGACLVKRSENIGEEHNDKTRER